MTDLVVDTDTTELNDDALALHYLFEAGRTPTLITTVFGNATARSSANAARRIAWAQGLDVPVSAGAERPLCWNEPVRRNLRATAASLPASTYLAALSTDNDTFWECAAEDGPAPSKLAEHLTRSSACDVLALGPTTNIARALQLLDPSVLSRHQLWVCGGAMTNGNVTETAEFNAFADPHALQVCLESAWATVTLVPLEVTSAPRLGPLEVDRIRRAPTPLGRALDELERKSPRRDSHDREPIWDVVAAVLLADGSVPYTASRGTISTHTDADRRGTTTFSAGRGPHTLITSVDPDIVLRRFEESVGGPVGRS